MLPCLQSLFGREKEETQITTDNDALVALLQTEYYKEYFLQGLIEVINKDGLTPEEIELLTRVELQITGKLTGESNESTRMVSDPGLQPH